MTGIENTANEIPVAGAAFNGCARAGRSREPLPGSNGWKARRGGVGK